MEVLHGADLTPALAALTPSTVERDDATASSNGSTESLLLESESGTANERDPTAAPAATKQTKQGRDWRPKATLHLKDTKEMGFLARLVHRGLMEEHYYEMKPADLDRGPVPVHKPYRTHIFVLTHCATPILIQQACYTIWPNYKWPIWLAYGVYVLSFAKYLIDVIEHIKGLVLEYGCLDEKNIGRDRVPDDAINQLASAFLYYIFGRTAGEFLLRWDSRPAPFDNFDRFTPLRWLAWVFVFDYFFYVYHRSCHEVDFLWKIHSRHHTTKHPSPVLAILADSKQEVIEIALVPLFASLVVPMSFHELFLLVSYTGYVEIMGHSGLRADMEHPIAGRFLSLFGCELVTEDHDLHHRYGKSGRNYGKSTRFWDKLFGTTTPREEMANMPGHSPF